MCGDVKRFVPWKTIPQQLGFYFFFCFLSLMLFAISHQFQDFFLVDILCVAPDFHLMASAKLDIVTTSTNDFFHFRVTKNMLIISPHSL